MPRTKDLVICDSLDGLIQKWTTDVHSPQTIVRSPQFLPSELHVNCHEDIITLDTADRMVRLFLPREDSSRWACSSRPEKTIYFQPTNGDLYVTRSDVARIVKYSLEMQLVTFASPPLRVYLQTKTLSASYIHSISGHACRNKKETSMFTTGFIFFISCFW